jgi:hypothetical protein
MRKFVSLGAAIMMGAVLGRVNHATTLAGARAIPKTIQAAQKSEPIHLERPVKLHPRHDSVGDVEAEKESIRSSSSDGLASRDSLRSRSRRNVKNRPRSRRSIQTKEWPGPNKGFCGGRFYFLKEGQIFQCFDRSDGYLK